MIVGHRLDVVTENERHLGKREDDQSHIARRLQPNVAEAVPVGQHKTLAAALPELPASVDVDQTLQKRAASQLRCCHDSNVPWSVAGICVSLRMCLVV